MTDKMNPNGSTRDMITINITDNEISVYGYPIEAANGNIELKYRR